MNPQQTDRTGAVNQGNETQAAGHGTQTAPDQIGSYTGAQSGPAVFLGDDFTGASDSMATYARGGWRSRLMLRPKAERISGLEVLGIPTDLRAQTPGGARATVNRLWPAIAAQSPSVLHLKVCSTFDSAPHVGSIGAVVQALSARFEPDVVAVIGGQPSLGRYCIFGTLFARGPDGQVHRIDRHPVMARHPVTPMAEADLLRHLGAQGLGLRLVSQPMLGDAGAVAAELAAGPVLFDVLGDRDLDQIAAHLATKGGRQLLIGASSVAQILTRGRAASAETGTSREKTAEPTQRAPGSSAVLAIAGSRSSVTAAQVAAARGFDRVPLDPEALSNGAALREAAALLARGRHVLAHLVPDSDYGCDPDTLNNLLSSFTLALLAQVPLGYLAIAGGDTSSRLCEDLGFDTLEYHRDMGQGVCICIGAHGHPLRNGMRVMLKGGQMGATDLFDRFAAFAAKGG